MHFHLPKPLHGWRELVGEVGIIVIGVLIALSAEQAVEAVHWRNEVAAERASLLQDAKDSFAGVAARKDQQPCVDHRLQEIRMILERHHQKRALALIGPIGRPTHQSAARGSWQIALSGQALSHMQHEEKLQFSDVFTAFDLFDKAEDMERDIWMRLTPLNTPDLLTDEDWSGITTAYNQAADLNERMRVLAPWLLDKTLPGLERYQDEGDLSRFQEVVDQICKPVLASGANGKAG